jgi:signal transduction histidine kinase
VTTPVRLAPRLALFFGLLAAASSVGVGVAVRYRLEAMETERFRADVAGQCERIKVEVRRQAEADHTLITGFCDAHELVEAVGVAIDNGELAERATSFSALVQTKRRAFGVDELLVAADRGDIVGASPPALLGLSGSAVDGLLHGDSSSFSLRTSGVPAIVTRCTKRSLGGRLVGMVAARHVDPLLDRLETTLAVTVVPSWPRPPASAEPSPERDETEPARRDAGAAPKHGKGHGTGGAPVPSAAKSAAGPNAAGTGSSAPPGTPRSLPGGAERTVCQLEDGHGDALRFDVIKSTRDLEANLAELDRTVGVLAIVAAAVAFLVAVLLARSIGRPLAVLATEAGKVAAGEAQPIRVRGSGEVRELGLAFDKMITDLAATRRRLAAASRVAAWREVARRVAHEVKNPLAPIRAAVETLRRLRAREDPRFDEYFDEATRTVLDEVHRISNIVTEFTRFARLPPPRPQELDADEVARHVVQVHGAAAGSARLIQREARPGIGKKTLRADRDQVIQVLTNLVQNALDAVKDTPSGEVILTTDSDGHDVSWAVSDNGSGVPPEFAGRLFEPYATTKASGTGLGLAIAQRIAYEHNGELSYAGPGLGGRGSTFRLALPVEGPPPASELPPPPPSSS